MNPVYQSAFLKALGWSLIDSLWQMGGLWFLYVLITGNSKKFTASFRYSLALITLFIGSVSVLLNVWINYQDPVREFSIFGNAFFLINYLPVLSASYLIIASFYITRWLYQYTDNKSLRYNISPVSEEIVQLIDQLKYITAIGRSIGVWCSDKISTPLTTGFLKPVILLPVAAFAQLSTRQVEALIVHEFFHIKRNDYLVNLVTSFAGAFLFFNPFAKLLLKNIYHERENCCDDEVIRLGYDRWEYAHALYLLSKNHQQEYRFAIAATGSGKHLLLARIKRLLSTSTLVPCIKKPLVLFFLCLFIAGSFTRTVNNQPVIILAKKETRRISNIGMFANPLPGRGGRANARPGWVAEKPAKIKVSPHPPAVIKNISNGEIHALYVSSNIETLEFSILEAPVSSTPKPENTDPTQPFVPGSTFYFPTHDIPSTSDGKTIIHL
jgi:beta-lactamase regulating signal transducer with metallopeptidase domain